MKINKNNKFLEFLKKNWLVLASGFMVLVIGTTIGVVSSVQNNQNVEVVNPDDDKGGDDDIETPKDPDDDNDNDDNIDDDESVDVKDPLVFALPMNSPMIIKDFSDTQLQYNETLDRWESHMAVDLTSSDLNVLSVLDGEIISIEYDFFDGYVVKIRHDEGFVSSYGSLEEVVGLEEGEQVKKGDKIGKASTTASNSSSYGNHMEFILLKDDQKIDPNSFLDLENK